jgi:hypothetical protein
LIGVFGAPIALGLLPSVILSRRKLFPPGVAKKYAYGAQDIYVVLESAHLSSRDVIILQTWQNEGWLRVDLDGDYDGTSDVDMFEAD